MNAKKLIIGGIVAGIIYMVLGWITYGGFFLNYFKTHTGLFFSVHADLLSDFSRPKFLLSYLILGNLLEGFLLSYVFVKGNISSFGSGLVTGAVVGLLGGSAFDFIAYSTTTLLSRSAIAADVIIFTIISAIAGAIAAIASGSGTPSSE